MSLPINHNLFKEYKGDCRIFVESGSFRGDGIQAAVEAGFDFIISFDIDPACIEFCKNRFDLFRKPNPDWELYCADSAEELGSKIMYINEPILFWLDAHYQMDSSEPGDNPFPLLKELEQIAKHPVKNHVILIDDFLYMSHKDITGWDKRKIEAAVKRINKDYVITYESNPIKNNILIAHV